MAAGMSSGSRAARELSGRTAARRLVRAASTRARGFKPPIRRFGLMMHACIFAFAGWLLLASTCTQCEYDCLRHASLPRLSLRRLLASSRPMNTVVTTTGSASRRVLALPAREAPSVDHCAATTRLSTRSRRNGHSSARSARMGRPRAPDGTGYQSTTSPRCGPPRRPPRARALRSPRCSVRDHSQVAR